MARNEKERDLDGWKNAPVPLCMGGDLRALTWCCKPGYSLTFGYKCIRDEILKKVGLSAEKFITLKEQFSAEQKWDDDLNATCFGSLSYCCMRNSGCERRDYLLKAKYKGKKWNEIKKVYFEKKKVLAKRILQACENRAIVSTLLDDFE